MSQAPPLEMLYLMPKSPLGPPGLWLAVRMIPPTAFNLQITQDTAGVDMIPFCPITSWPIWNIRGYMKGGLYEGMKFIHNPDFFTYVIEVQNGNDNTSSTYKQ